MSQTNTIQNQAGNVQATKVQFIQYHQPGLQDGEYQIDVTKTIEATNGSIPKTSYKQSLKFAVSGERFSLNPREIKEVFPPQSNLGDHSNVFPHILITRSTLPWERSAIAEQKELPWLVVLLFDESEKPTKKVLTLEQLKKTSTKQFPKFDYEISQHPEDLVTVIDIPKKLLKTIMPSTKELALLTHVRQGLDEKDQSLGNEFAVIFGNRLPKSGNKAIAHLVSVENRYTKQGFNFSGTGETIRLVTLKNWWFSCTDKNECFEQLLLNIDQTPNTLRLPENSNPDVERYFKNGYVPLRHHTLKGTDTISWYRSPLITGNSTQDISLPARSSDELIIKNIYNKLIDVSYSAAWELGRLLTLQSKKVSVDLFNWKRSHSHNFQQKEETLFHLPLKPTEDIGDDYHSANSLNNWFQELSLLKNIPFHYLVPDEKMLPVESIRFFQIEQAWVNCLLDGAFSIGRVTTADYKLDQKLKNKLLNAKRASWGFLLRSDVVAGWPSLIVDSGADGVASQLLRMERLSDHILFCIFSGIPTTVNIHLKAESLHFGVEEIDVNTYQKRLRDAEGNLGTEGIPIPWKSPESMRVVDIANLAKTLNTSTSADFALEMIEGVPKVRFNLIS
ncbi:MAG: hypothetical protein AAGA80_08615 [Cyanobacteria bacterium P01_F01_bin.143]